MLLQLPGIGMFRAPARYTLLTSLGLVLLAGRGLDVGRSASPRRFWVAFGLAIAFGAAAVAWSAFVAQGAEFRAAMGETTIAIRFAATAVTWALGLVAVVAWRRRTVGAWAPVGLAAVELSTLFFLGPVEWDWSVRLSESSPALRRLVEAD